MVPGGLDLCFKSRPVLCRYVEQVFYRTGLFFFLFLVATGEMQAMKHASEVPIAHRVWKWT